jgi:DNA invertase Pin-like site-specific DNA recombinase
MKMATKTKTAYSYIRFSSGRQGKGDSVRRQLEWGEGLCRQKGWTLDENLDLDDKAVSAFRGANAATGKLGAFLEAVKAGTVKPGSVLLVESLDRVSREDIDAGWQLFRKILIGGVEIVTREPERHYTKKDLKDLGTHVEVAVYFQRACDESRVKSMRGKSYWDAVRGKLAAGTSLAGRDGRLPHKVAPAWLKLAADRKRFEVIPEAAKAVKLIFQWAAEGLGINPVCAKLNAVGIKPIGNVRNKEGEAIRTRRKDTWCRSYVAKILADRAVVGEYQPHESREVDVGNGQTRWRRVPVGKPIPGYFPRIISDDEWYRVRAAVKGRGKTRGRTAQVINLFAGLIRDARDGETAHQVYNHSPLKANARQLLSYGCRNGVPGTPRLPIPYDPTEQMILRALTELKAEDMVGTKTDERQLEVAALAGRLADLDDKIAKSKARVAAEPDTDILLDLITDLGKERKAAAAELEKVRGEAAQDQPGTLTETRTLIDLLRRTEGAERLALRTRVKVKVRQLVQAIWILPWEVAPGVRAAEVQVVLHSGKFWAGLLVWKRRGRHRGMTFGFGNVVGKPGEAAPHLAGKRLADYRTDPATAAWFADCQDKTRAAILKLVDAETAVEDVRGRWQETPEGKADLDADEARWRQEEAERVAAEWHRARAEAAAE